MGPTERNVRDPVGFTFLKKIALSVYVSAAVSFVLVKLNMSFLDASELLCAIRSCSSVSLKAPERP